MLSRRDYDAVTFDLVNTLAIFDPPEVIISRFIRRFGVRKDPEYIRSLFTKIDDSLMESFSNPREYYISLNNAVLEMLNLPRKGLDLLHYWFEKENYRLEEGLRTVLGSLKSKGFRLGIISNNLSWEVRLFLKENGLEHYFDAYVTPDIAHSFKPEKTIFEKALDMLKVSRLRTVHVGDSILEDYLAAKEAGLDAILLLRENEESVKELGIKYVRCLKELVGLKCEA